MNFILGSNLFKTKIDVNFEIFKPNLSWLQPMLVDDPEKWSVFFADEHLAITQTYISKVQFIASILKKQKKIHSPFDSINNFTTNPICWS